MRRVRAAEAEGYRRSVRVHGSGLGRGIAVSEPVYLIDVVYLPTNPIAKWSADVRQKRTYTDPIDGETVEEWDLLTTCAGDTAEEAERRARQFVKTETAKREGYSVYVDENGETVHSVRA